MTTAKKPPLTLVPGALAGAPAGGKPDEPTAMELSGEAALLHRDYGSPELNEKVRAARDALPTDVGSHIPDERMRLVYREGMAASKLGRPQEVPPMPAAAADRLCPHCCAVNLIADAVRSALAIGVDPDEIIGTVFCELDEQGMLPPEREELPPLPPTTSTRA